MPDDLTAIQAGLEELEAGQFVTLEEADADIRTKLGFAPRTTGIHHATQDDRSADDI